MGETKTSYLPPVSEWADVSATDALVTDAMIEAGVEAFDDWCALSIPNRLRAAYLAMRNAAPDGEDLRRALEAEREALRVHMLEQPITFSRDTYSDGYFQGVSMSIGRIDKCLAAIGQQR